MRRVPEAFPMLRVSRTPGRGQRDRRRPQEQRLVETLRPNLFAAPNAAARGSPSAPPRVTRSVADDVMASDVPGQVLSPFSAADKKGRCRAPIQNRCRTLAVNAEQMQEICGPRCPAVLAADYVKLQMQEILQYRMPALTVNQRLRAQVNAGVLWQRGQESRRARDQLLQK